MECDLSRLWIAIDAARSASLERMRFEASLHGKKLDEPLKEAESDEDFNAQAENVMAMLGARL